MVLVTPSNKFESPNKAPVLFNFDPCPSYIECIDSYEFSSLDLNNRMKYFYTGYISITQHTGEIEKMFEAKLEVKLN